MATESNQPHWFRQFMGRIGFWCSAVLLPLLAIAVETQLQVLSGCVLSPTRSWGQFLALLAVPFSLAAAEVLLSRNGASRKALGWAAFLNGYAITLSLLYILSSWHIILMSTFAILIGGIGLIGWSPLFAFGAGLAQLVKVLKKRQKLMPQVRFSGVGLAMAGVVVALLVAAGVQARQFMVIKTYEQAYEASGNEQQELVKRLRWLRAEPELHQACYGKFPQTGLFPNQRTSDSDASYKRDRELYYLVTGQAYNSKELEPTGLKFRRRHEPPAQTDWQTQWINDSEIGGSRVGTRVPGLSLQSSTIDGEVTQGPGVAYLEWIMEFRNDSNRQREARAQLALPPGAVPSLLTLWIEGEERQAAYSSVQKVREAYRSVAVVQRRDPALLTMSGPDRALLQCFPILPQSTMKVKVGITIPLKAQGEQAWLRLPYLAERNFSIDQEFEHGVWISADAPVRHSNDGWRNGQTDSGFSVRGPLDETALQTAGSASLAVDAPEATGRFHARLDTMNATMRWETPLSPESSRVILVVDGSVPMRSAMIDWQGLVNAFPEGIEINAMVATAIPEVWREAPVTIEGHREELGNWLESTTFEGGGDPVPALELAWDSAAEVENSTICWIHAAQPVLLEPVDGLAQRLRNRPAPPAGNGPRLLHTQVVPGPHTVINQLTDIAGIEPVLLVSDMQETLESMAKHLSGETLVRRYALGSELAGQGQATTDHLARLAIYEHVRHEARSDDEDARVAAGKLAAAAKLITPLSGAVVLERREQYKDHGLDVPGEEVEGIPSVPEPEEWALLLIAAGGLGLLLWRRRHTQVVGA